MSAGKTRQATEPGMSVLAAWAESSGRRRGRGPAGGGLRFAFYGRVSTEDWQDPVSSRARQREEATALARGHGVIVAEFFDEGHSRSVAWARRPQATALIAALADPGRGWDAIVVGEFVSEHDERVMTILGLSSKREVARTSIRVRTAMAVQAREQGRYLGGRPPYGYQLGDAGPDPNKAHAAWGRRAHRLEPDPETAHVVSWMFAQRLAGYSVARIARTLNDAGVPCPSAADPGRNSHRSGAGWTLRTIATILGNPRYTGRRVWNRQRTDKELVDPADVSLGHRGVQRWNLPDGWVISERPAHTALVSEQDFIAAQAIAAALGPAPDGDPAAPRRRRYLLAGLLACGTCGRKMESAWSNGRVAYRCRHGHTTAVAPGPGRPPNAYVREDRILALLPGLHLLLTGTRPARHRRTRRGTDARPQDVIGYLREHGITLTYDPAAGTLRAGTGEPTQTITLKAS